MIVHLKTAAENQIIAVLYIWVIFKEGFGAEEGTKQFSPTKKTQLNLLAAV